MESFGLDKDLKSLSSCICVLFFVGGASKNDTKPAETSPKKPKKKGKKKPKTVAAVAPAADVTGIPEEPKQEPESESMPQPNIQTIDELPEKTEDVREDESKEAPNVAESEQIAPAVDESELPELPGITIFCTIETLKRLHY